MYGIDISGYQGHRNWQSIATDFIIFKATEGAAYVDSAFAWNQSEGRRTGRLRGYYHFARPDQSAPQTEANHFVDTVGALAPGEIMALDWEHPYGGNPWQWCLLFLNQVERRVGFKPFVYADLSHVPSLIPVGDQGYPLWVAAWGNHQPGTAWRAPQPLWQYSMYGPPSCPGADSDIFNGDAAAFQRFGYKGGGPVPTPIKPKEDEMYDRAKGTEFLIEDLYTARYGYWLHMRNVSGGTVTVYLTFRQENPERNIPAGGFDLIPDQTWRRDIVHIAANPPYNVQSSFGLICEATGAVSWCLREIPK